MRRPGRAPSTGPADASARRSPAAKAVPKQPSLPFTRDCRWASSPARKKARLSPRASLGQFVDDSLHVLHLVSSWARIALRPLSGPKCLQMARAISPLNAFLPVHRSFCSQRHRQPGVSDHGDEGHRGRAERRDARVSVVTPRPPPPACSRIVAQGTRITRAFNDEEEARKAGRIHELRGGWVDQECQKRRARFVKRPTW